MSFLIFLLKRDFLRVFRIAGKKVYCAAGHLLSEAKHRIHETPVNIITFMTEAIKMIKIDDN